MNRTADRREQRDKSRWDIIQFYEPPPRLRYLYKSAVENSPNREPNPSFYLLSSTSLLHVLFVFPPAAAATISSPTHIETLVLLLHAFCSPLRQVRDGLTRNYLLGKFLREKLLLPQRSNM
ncbi:hypothetical protein EAG_14750 [Camponotus floridanus]|uniref:Uncharacterized protein n=1 Tax=Camponotus floridanus TaxID=104421 RepID=E2A984_CAMFO|nr:hypothetical protein EAG_14750 [Camponotus floridanus]